MYSDPESVHWHSDHWCLRQADIMVSFVSILTTYSLFDGISAGDLSIFTKLCCQLFLALSEIH